MTNYLNQGRVRLKDRDVEIWNLEVKITINRIEVVCIKSQFSTTKTMCNQTFGYGYGIGLECLRSFFIANP